MSKPKNENSKSTNSGLPETLYLKIEPVNKWFTLKINPEQDFPDCVEYHCLNDKGQKLLTFEIVYKKGIYRVIRTTDSCANRTENLNVFLSAKVQEVPYGIID